ncbi:MAG: hypothetical protein KKI09_14275 [Spirochaetes bacterium]|nr:hypothetical protein [Spirochaetota bacterium]MBU0956594.1 hypothetical protein [Spirochaetota bacterium]
MKKLILGLVLISAVFFLSSCDYGLADGSDLVGSWTGTLVLLEQTYVFNADNTGSLTSLGTSTFTWDVVANKPYKLLNIVYDDDSSEVQFEYYFTLGGGTLHLHSTEGTALWMNLDKDVE